jgi:FkbM family methyltransferase
MTISYAQNGEDIILRRAFGEQKNGFYIDVGACFPDEGSVTKLFYDEGWTGINIEPHPHTFTALLNARSKDLNLNVAISDYNGKGMIAEGTSLGESTFVKPGQAGFPVQVMTLRSVCEQFVDTMIDFLKIDVEGSELLVLKGADFLSFRPRIILCEITKPWSNTRSDSESEIDVLLADHGYQKTYFDGLNNYYVAEEALIPRSVWFQPNVVDNYTTWREAELSKSLEELRSNYNVLFENTKSAQEVDQLLKDNIAQLDELREVHLAEILQMRTKFDDELIALRRSSEEALQRQRDSSTDEITRLHAVITEQSKWGSEMIMRVRQLELEIRGIHSSASWKFLAPFRLISELPDLFARNFSIVMRYLSHMIADATSSARQAASRRADFVITPAQNSTQEKNNDFSKIESALRLEVAKWQTGKSLQ